MRAPLPSLLPDRLPAYLPGRIAVVPDELWDIGTEAMTGLGLRIEVPRYGLDLRTRDLPIDPLRVRWLTERSTTRPLGARHVHLLHHHGVLHVVDGHHALAAHLITGAERIPAKLVARAVA